MHTAPYTMQKCKSVGVVCNREAHRRRCAQDEAAPATTAPAEAQAVGGRAVERSRAQPAAGAHAQKDWTATALARRELPYAARSGGIHRGASTLSRREVKPQRKTRPCC